jgi:hypothetical protein
MTVEHRGIDFERENADLRRWLAEPGTVPSLILPDRDRGCEHVSVCWMLLIR